MARSPTKAPIGSKFGKWTVIAQAESRHGARWLCRCECGKEAILRSNYVRNKAGSCRSCAYTGKVMAKGSNSKIWNGHGEISGQYWHTVCRSSALRKHKIEISIKDAWEQFLVQDRKCALSGVELSFAPCQSAARQQTASLDRIDSTKGYELGNVQWVHKDINWMKGSLSDADFINWCRLVADRQVSVI